MGNHAARGEDAREGCKPEVKRTARVWSESATGRRADCAGAWERNGVKRECECLWGGVGTTSTWQGGT
jgi:hypothetical protein